MAIFKSVEQTQLALTPIDPLPVDKSHSRVRRNFFSYPIAAPASGPPAPTTSGPVRLLLVGQFVQLDTSRTNSRLPAPGPRRVAALHPQRRYPQTLDGDRGDTRSRCLGQHSFGDSSLPAGAARARGGWLKAPGGGSMVALRSE